MRELAQRVRTAGRELAGATGAERSAALGRMAEALQAREDELLAANQLDVAAADEAVAAGRMTEALAARLPLSSSKLATLAEGLRSLAAREDPLGKLKVRRRLGEGVVLEQRTVPIGTLLVVFESRPDALVQVAALAVRSGNGLLLKGGKEAAHSNRALHAVLSEALAPLPADGLGLVEGRADVDALLALDDLIDLVIPRGSNALVRHVQDSTRIPVLGHADGVCHVYVDVAAAPARARALVVDSKVDYPAACNAMETLLIHRDYADADGLVAALRDAGVVLFGGPDAAARWELEPVVEFHHEYGDLAASVAFVDDLDAAVAHIHAHGSGHTECIVTSDPVAADRFLATVDSASVFHDVSTRFADGFRYGLGAEVGVSTSRIHARGPVGVDGLLTTRWTARGQGHTVGAVRDGTWSFAHEDF